jgi:nicotinate-nucleotide adenylyltransferase
VESIGILGGTFNPPHLGHLAVATHAGEQLGLRLMLLMPARIPPHKPAGEDPGPEQRLQMCRALVHGKPGIDVSALEIERDGASYTVDTLRSMHSSHPDAELTFIVGADTASTMASWREPEAILSLARLAVASREGSERRRVLDTVIPLSDGSASVVFLDMGEVAISSSLVRARLADGEPVDGLTGPDVARYIDEHHLYRVPEPA